MRDKVTRPCPQTTSFEEKGEPKRIQTEVPLLTARPNRLIIVFCFVFDAKSTSTVISGRTTALAARGVDTRELERFACFGTTE